MQVEKESLQEVLEYYLRFPDFLGESSLKVDSLGVTGDLILHIAARVGNNAHVRILLDNGADVNAQGDMGFAPLHYASMRGHEETVTLLIDVGADVTLQNEWGQTPSDVARLAGFNELSRLLSLPSRRHRRS